MQYLIHIANVLYLLSYLVRDILWLRVLTVVAGLTLLASVALQEPLLWAPILWNCLFTAINGVQIVRLILERRPVKLSEDEERLYQASFRALTARQFLRMAKAGAWRQAAEGERLVEEGVVLGEMMCLLSGSLAVKVEGRQVATLGAGRLIGEMSYLTETATTASVEVVEPAVYMAWSKPALTALFDKDATLRSGLQLVIGRDLVNKLRVA